MIKHQLNTILQTEMDRKSFLKHLGIATIAVMGIPAVLKTFDAIGKPQSSEIGYGSSAYGGSPKQIHS